MNDRDELSALLRTWRHDPLPAPDFARGVWSRVHTAETRPVARILRFPLPFALPIAAGLAVILGVGSGLASNRAQTTDRMAAAYARTIDPILMTAPGSADSHAHP